MKIIIFNFLDIKGVIQEIGTVSQGTQKLMDKQWERQSIKIRNDKEENIVIVLWNANVQNFSAKVGDTIELYNCVIDKYNGNNRVSTNTSTTFITKT